MWKCILYIIITTIFFLMKKCEGFGLDSPPLLWKVGCRNAHTSVSLAEVILPTAILFLSVKLDVECLVWVFSLTKWRLLPKYMHSFKANFKTWSNWCSLPSEESEKIMSQKTSQTWVSFMEWLITLKGIEIVNRVIVNSINVNKINARLEYATFRNCCFMSSNGRAAQHRNESSAQVACLSWDS